MWSSLTAKGEAVSGFALGPIVSMSLDQLFLGGLVSTRAHLRFTSRFPSCNPRPELSTTTRQGVGNFHYCPANTLRRAQKSLCCLRLRADLACRDLNDESALKATPGQTTMLREPRPNRLLPIAELLAGS